MKTGFGSAWMPLAFLLCVPCLARAGQSSSGVVGEAAPYLLIPTSAREAGMGGAFVAVDGDVNDLGVNPAGLGFMKEQQLSLMHDIWIQDSTVDHLGYGLGLWKGGGMAAGVDLFNLAASPLTPSAQARASRCAGLT